LRTDEARKGAADDPYQRVSARLRLKYITGRRRRRTLRSPVDVTTSGGSAARISRGQKIRTLTAATVALLAFGLAASAAGAGFKLYPGATKYTPPDTEENKQFTSSLRPGTTITAYLTKDSFEDVVTFYKGFANEYTGPKARPGSKLPNGQEIRRTFLILDGAPDILHSRSWISVQRPFFGSVSREGGELQYKDVRDVTEIVLTEKAETKKEQ